MAAATPAIHQDQTRAASDLQRVFGKPPAPSYGGGGLRLRFDGVDRGGKELGDMMTEAGATVEVRVKTPATKGLEDMIIGTIGGMAFMANGLESKGGGYGVDVRIYASESKQAMVGPDALFAMLDALLQAHPVPPDALPGYLAYRLGKDKNKDARRLAGEISAVVTEYLTR